MTRTFILSVLVGLCFANVAVAAPIAISSYVYNATGFYPEVTYKDNGFYTGDMSPTPNELRDGLFPASPAYLDPAWVGIEDVGADDPAIFQPSLTFDLGGLYTINSATVHYLVDHGSQVYADDSVAVRFSTDGLSFSAPINFSSFTDPAGPASIQSSTMSLGANAGRFVRMDFLNDQHWAFYSEIQFDGVLIPAPEPTSFVLLGLGMLALRRKTSRRAA